MRFVFLPYALLVRPGAFPSLDLPGDAQGHRPAGGKTHLHGTGTNIRQEASEWQAIETGTLGGIPGWWIFLNFLLPGFSLRLDQIKGFGVVYIHT
jgi:hypothetical protein